MLSDQRLAGVINISLVAFWTQFPSDEDLRVFSFIYIYTYTYIHIHKGNKTKYIYIYTLLLCCSMFQSSTPTHVHFLRILGSQKKSPGSLKQTWLAPRG